MANIQIKQNPEDGTTELWIRGEFVAGWNTIEIPVKSHGVLEAMMREVYDQAVKVGETPLRDAIRRALQS